MDMNGVLVLVSFLLGFYLGTKRSPKDDLKEAKIALGETLKEITKDKSDLKIGALKRPTVKKMEQAKEDNVTKEGKLAMKETLDKMPEFKDGGW